MKFIALPIVLFFLTNIAVAQSLNRKSKNELIEEIKSKSGIIIVDGHTSNKVWNFAELSAIADVLDNLPDEYKLLKTITLQKNNFVFPKHWRFKTSARFKKHRRILELNLHKADILTIRRTIIEGLSLVLDKDNRITESDKWRAYGGWVGLDLFGNSTQNHKVEGFACRNGMKSPEYDFATFAAEFFLPSDFTNTCYHLRYRLPSKYNYFSSLFELKPDPQKNIVCSNTYRQWINPDDVEHFEILFASPTATSAANIAGHILLLIKRKGDEGVEGLSRSISFVARTYIDGVTDEGFVFAWKGLTGQYPSMIQEENFAEVVTRAQITENRDLYRLKLNLTRDETVQAIQRLWELRNTFSTPYFFLNKNCATLYMDFMNDILPDNKKVITMGYVDMPINLTSKLYFLGKITEFVYPEYWSSTRMARWATAKNKSFGRDFISSIQKLLPDKNKAKLLQQFNKAFNGTVSRKKDFSRVNSYARLYYLYTQVFYRYIKHTDDITQQEYFRIGKQLHKYYIYSMDRERYISSEEVLAKTKNTDEINIILARIFYLRGFLDKHANFGKDAGEEIETELTAESVRSRKNVSYVSQGYAVFTSLNYHHQNHLNYLRIPIRLAGLSQKLGDKSVFALRQDIGWNVFVYEFVPGILLDNIPDIDFAKRMTYIHKLTGVDVNVLMTGINVDYKGVLIPGFGFTFWDSVSSVWENIENDITWIEGRFLLGLFEIDDFSHFMMTGIGAGYSTLYDTNDNATHFVDVKIPLEIKFYLFGNTQNVFRIEGLCKARFPMMFKPKFDFEKNVPISLRLNVEFTFGLGKMSNSLIYIGGYYEHIFTHNIENGMTRFGEKRFGTYFTLKFDRQHIYVNTRKILNRIF